MFRWVTGNLPVFVCPNVRHIDHYRDNGWFLLAREDEIRMADIEDTRRSDERGIWGSGS